MGAPSLAVALDACLKATLLLGAAALAVRGLRHGSAAARHFVWTLGLASALLLPLLGLVAPAWELPLVPHEWRPVAEAPAPVAPKARLAPPKVTRTAAAPAPREAEKTAPVAAAAPPLAASRPKLDRDAMIWLAWAAGVVLVLLPLGAGSARLWWLARRSQPASESWAGLAREVGESLGLRRPVALIRGERRAMPMAWGVLRAAILLPEDAEDWPEQRRRSVLTHELAHVLRRDCLTQALAHVACAVYWFHPLAWLAAKRMRAERERACDDLVLGAGAAGPDYADHLLEMARGLRAARHPALATVAMARPSQLEGRLLAILDPSLQRGAPSRARLLAAAALAAAVLVPLAGLQPWSKPAHAAPPSLVLSTEGKDAEHREIEATPEAVATGAAPTPQTRRTAAAEKEHERETREHESEEADSEEEPAPLQQDPRVVEALGEALKDSDAEVRRDAAFALGQIRSASSAAALAAALSDSDAEVRTQAAFALGQIRSQASVAALAKALVADAEQEVRTQAAFALGQLRSEAAVDALAKALAADADAEVRTQAAFALGQIRSPATTAALAAAIADKHADVRKQAVFAIGQVRDAGSVDALSKALRDADGEVREQAAFALGQIRDERAVGALVAALDDKEDDVRKQAVFALGQIRAAGAVAGLSKALRDSSADVREQAAFALGQIRSKEALPLLSEALKDKEPDVRKQAAFALGQIGDERAIAALTAALKDADAEVRRQAAFALSQVTR